MSEAETDVPVADTRAKRLFLSVDAVGGWIAIAIGVMAIAEGFRLGLGTLAKMGPGYFPTAAGIALIGLGLLLVINALRKGGALARVPFGIPVILLLAALVSFGVLLPIFGLVPATITLMLISAFAVTGRIGVGDIIYAVLTSVAAVLIFINGLGVVLPAVRWPF
jgi:hypothetical protein